MLSFLTGLWDLLRRHPRVVIPAILLLVTYFVVDYIIFEHPGDVIRKYYENLAEGRTGAAWQLLSADYRAKRWHNDLTTFSKMYASFNRPEKDVIVGERPEYREYINTILSGTRNFEHRYIVYERFTKADLLDPVNAENKLWVNIYHKRDLPRLMNDEITTEDGGPASLHVRRFFDERIGLQRKQGEWKITYIHRSSWGLTRLAPE